VRGYVREAVDTLNAAAFEQEPHYIAALMGRLRGIAYKGPDAFVEFRTTVVSSIGPPSAERWSGADFAITANIERGDIVVEKAILGQAKRGGLDELSHSEQDRLVDQVRKMLELTRSPKVVFIPEVQGRYEPVVASGVRIANGLKTTPIPISDYVVRRILTTLDGDTRPRFVARVQSSSLSQVRILAGLGPFS
jgi:hypothetical protein